MKCYVQQDKRKHHRHGDSDEEVQLDEVKTQSIHSLEC